MSAWVALAVGLGAGLGSALRLGAERAHAAARRRHGLPEARFPWPTLLVNALGSGLLGLLVGAHEAGLVTGTVLQVAGAGLCGGLTTFSTLAVDLALLLRARRWGTAAWYLAAQVLAGLGLFALGHALV